MKQLFLSLLFLIFSIFPAKALAKPAELGTDLQPMIQNYHSYTYVLEETGDARVWLLIDNVQTRDQVQVIRYTLPANYVGEVTAWYRESGCMEYIRDLCVYYGNTNWLALEIQSDNRQLEITVPKASYVGHYGENSVSLGLMFNLSQVTSKNWWGRTVNIETGASDQYVASVNIGVYLPQGLYTRDRSQGPDNWARSLSESIRINQDHPADLDMMSGQAMMLDRAGTGQLYRYGHSLLPGSTYAFSFMSANSLWQLYYAELLMALLWLLAIATVIAGLLSLLIGKKPLRWYLAFIGFLVLLSVLLGGLWFTIYTAFGNKQDDYYPMPFARMEQDYGSDVVLEEQAVETMTSEEVIDDDGSLLVR